MIRSNEKIKMSANGRIAGLILLFALFSLPSAGQGNLPLNDTMRTGEQVPAPGRSVSPDTTTGDAIRGTPGRSSRGERVRMAEADSAKKEIYPDSLEHSPRKAMFFSLALPGLGQAYNKKYFKIPIVYAALGGVGYWIHFNTGLYRDYLEEYKVDDSYERYVKLARRQLELSYISLVGVYALQVLDAYVDAYLFYWDVSPDLSIRLAPSLEPTLMPAGIPVANYGLKFKMTFK